MFCIGLENSCHAIDRFVSIVGFFTLIDFVHVFFCYELMFVVVIIPFSSQTIYFCNIATM